MAGHPVDVAEPEGVADSVVGRGVGVVGVGVGVGECVGGRLVAGGVDDGGRWPCVAGGLLDPDPWRPPPW